MVENGHLFTGDTTPHEIAKANIDRAWIDPMLGKSGGTHTKGSPAVMQCFLERIIIANGGILINDSSINSELNKDNPPTVYKRVYQICLDGKPIQSWF